MNSKEQEQALEIGQRIGVLRIRQGLSQTDLAVRLGIKRGAVSHWENGVTTPSAHMLHALARELKSNMHWIWCGNEARFR